jgi:hypothetical protein
VSEPEHFFSEAYRDMDAALSRLRDTVDGAARLAALPSHAEESEREPDCRELAAGLDAAREE